MTLTRIPRRACSGVMLLVLPFLYFSLHKRVVSCARSSLPSSHPPCSSLATGRAAFGCNERESLRAKEVHHSFLGPIPKYTHLPVAGLLVTMLAVCQIPKLSAGFGF